MDPTAYLDADIGRGDITTLLTVPDRDGAAYITCEEDAVVAGLEEAVAVLTHVGATVETHVRDGERVTCGTRILTVTGPLRGLITAERTALNFLMHMSGIATLTSEAVERTGGGVVIAATRKTTPGFGEYQKKAVALGGGDPHRHGLDSMIMVKDNHIAACGSVRRAMELVSAAPFSIKVEVEVSSVEDAVTAAEMGADIIMADNMGPVETGELRDRVKGINPRILVEASGNMDLDRIGDYVGRADIISMGCLTHSAPSVQFSMDVE
ncbi:MAG: carboxylating nicotinate-nucleotide diphosphorylase [Candidatus Methanomethylophilaceae archaeon]|nr:carboxylating nicotinate-nucleotide diphosphorylase [Candidatus Methanomethylophilaceae archaeon]